MPMSSPGAVIEARGWGWRHAGRRAWAVRGLDLHIEAGERVLLLGPSGGGKSTLLLALAGLLDPRGGGEAEGTLRVDGRDPRTARDRSGLLFQDPEAQIILGRSGDDVAFGLENRCVPTDSIWPRVDAALDAVAFPYGRDHPTVALSGGEKQRLALAGTMALGPSLLLLDEPTANLDPDGVDALRELLPRALARLGSTLLLVEHRVDAASELVDRVVVIDGPSGVVADGPPGTVFGRHGDALAERGVWVPDHRVPPPRSPKPRPEAHTLLLAEGAGFTYPGASAPALVRVDAQVRASEVLAVTGPNGSGKSTLALLLAGLLRPTTGRVSATEALAPGSGHDPIWRWSARRLATRIGTVFADPEHQFLADTVRDELLLGPMHAGLEPAAARRRADALLDRLRLGPLAEANPFTLSGGEKRRLSVATALVAAPPILVLDEPTFGQDRRTWGEVLALLAGLRDDGRAICVASHDRDFVQALADRTLRLGRRRAD
jgi:energy-coupling factor transport system ATP-binding protein